MFCSKTTENVKINENQPNLQEQLKKEEQEAEEEYSYEMNTAANKKTWWNYFKSLVIFASMIVIPYQTWITFEKDIRKAIRKPLVDSLLPDQIIPPGYNKNLLPKTLVINLEGVLVDLCYDTEKHSYFLKKRPYMDYLLQKLSGKYELVLISAYDTMTLQMSVLPKLDPRQQYIHYMYGFEVWGKNTHKSPFKQLDCLNRDMKNVICIDFEQSSIAGFEENCCIVPEYKSDAHESTDQTLMSLTLFLEHLAKTPGDVRNELRKWGNLNAIENYRETLNDKMQTIKEKKGFLQRSNIKNTGFVNKKY